MRSIGDLVFKPAVSKGRQQLNEFILTRLPLIWDHSTPEARASAYRLLNLGHSVESCAVKFTTPFETVNQTDILRAQLFAEIIACSRPDLEKVLAFCKQQSPGSFLLLAAICHREQLPIPILLQVVSLLDFPRGMNPNLVSCALHTLSCLIVKQSDSILTLDLGAHFLTKLVEVLGSPLSLMPLMIHFVADVFIDLLPVISANLNHPSFTTLVLSILETIRVTPYRLAKDVYFNCLQSVLVFVPKLAQNLSAIQFPRRTSDAIKVRASAAISAFLKLGGKLQQSDILPDLFWLLQKTQDPRVSDCISALAATLDVDSHAIIIQIIHSIFIRNSVPGYAMIEPAICLRIAAFPLISVIIEENPQKALQIIAKSA
jgi:hypothetical protein